MEDTRQVEFVFAADPAVIAENGSLTLDAGWLTVIRPLSYTR